MQLRLPFQVLLALWGLVVASCPAFGQSRLHPAAKNLVVMNYFTNNGSYMHVHDVTGIYTGGHHYLLVGLKKMQPGGGMPAGVAVINVDNPQSPAEQIFIKAGDPDPSWPTGQREEHGNMAHDVEVYTHTNGNVYLLFSRESSGGVSVVDLTGALGSGLPEISASGSGASFFKATLSRLGKYGNPYPASEPGYPANRSQSHTIFIAGQYVYIATQTRYVDVWSLANPNSPAKVGVIELTVPKGTNQVAGQTLNVEPYCFFQPPASNCAARDTVALVPSVHELYATSTGANTSKLYVAFTRGGLQVFDVTLTASSTPYDHRLPIANLQRGMYDIDRDWPTKVDSDDPAFDFRSTHSAWPLQGGAYVVTTDEASAGDPQEYPDLHPPNIYDYVFQGNTVTGYDPDRLAGAAGVSRAGYFLRIWKTSELGTTSALRAGYDVPESVASVGRASLGAITAAPSTQLNSVHQVDLLGNYLYVASYSQGLRVLDVSNPEAPVEVAYYDPMAPITTSTTGGNDHVFDGVYDVYPDPNRPGLVYAGVLKYSAAGPDTLSGVLIARHLTGGPMNLATIPHDVILEGSHTMMADLDVSSGAVVRLASGSTLSVNDGTVLRAYGSSRLAFAPGSTVKLGLNAQIAAWGQVIAEGTAASRIRFERLSAAQPFNQLTLLGNGSVLRHVVVDGGDQNIVLAAQNVTLEHVTLKNGWRGLSTWTIPGGGRASATLRNVRIEGSTTVGLVGQYADLTLHATPVSGVLQGVTIQNSGEAGLYLSNATALGTHRLTVTGSGTTNALRSGVEVWSGTFTPGGYSYNNANEWGGHNRIFQNANHEVYIGPSGNASLGVEDFTDGLNSLYDPNQTPASSAKLVKNDNTGAWVAACYNWWGMASPASGYFAGLVDVCEPLASDANASAPLAVGGGQAAHEGFDLATASVQGPATTERRVQARMRGLLEEVQRGGEASATALATARTLRHLLAPGDPLRASFVQVRGEAASYLGAQRSAALDRLAETAMLLHALDLVEADDAAGALAVLSAAEGTMQDAGVRGRAAHVRVFALVQAGRTGEAQAAAKSLSQGDSSPEIAHVLGEIARFAWMTDAPQAEGPGAMARASSAQAAEAGEATAFGLRVWPQPVRGRATVRVSLPEASQARVEVYDLVGRRVAVLLDGLRAAGTHEVTFEAGALPAGLYLVRLSAGAQQRTERLAVVR